MALHLGSTHAVHFYFASMEQSMANLFPTLPFGSSLGESESKHVFLMCCLPDATVTSPSFPMKKDMSLPGDSFGPGEGPKQMPTNQNPFFHSDTLLLPKKRKSQYSFVVRISEQERLMIDALGDHFGETIMTIITKSLRLYRAIAEAADEGGSLVMMSEEKGYSLGQEGVRRGLSLHHEKKIRTIGYSQKITTDTGITVTVPPPGNDTFNDTLNDNHYPFSQAEPSSTGGKHTLSDNLGTKEAIIAVRDQFADNGLTPITLNPLYIAALKGSKSEKITLKTDASFVERLQALEKKTGFTKSLIVRDSVQLYDFVKRKFQEPGIRFFIGGKPILVI